jgi:YVTN family beta-propeller protein
MQFNVLGPLEVREGERAVYVGTGRQRTLLAILLLNANEVVSTDRLIDALWIAGPPPTAAKALQGHVSQLRKLLGQESLLTQSPGYVLRVERAQVDSSRFEDLVAEAAVAEPAQAARILREALLLWRGAPLPEFAFDEFAQPEIGRLEELHVTALERRIDADLELGGHSDVIGELATHIEQHPLRERFREQLMLSLYRSGRQAEALQAYQSARQALVDELGLEPSERLRQLQRAILSHDRALESPLPPAEEAPVRRFRGRRWWIAAAASLAAVTVGALVALGGESTALAVNANSIAVINAKTNRVTADVPVGSGPDAVAVGAGGVWVANRDDGTVTRIDPRTRRVVSTIGIGGDVSDIAVGFGSVWVADGNDGTLTRIDPSQNAVQATFRFASASSLAPQPVYSVTTGDRGVWVTRGDRLLRIDPVSGRVTLRVRLEPPVGLAEDQGTVWVTTTVDHVLRIDADSGAFTGKTSLPDRGLAPVLTDGSVWMIVGNPGEAPAATKVWQLNPATGSATATAPGAFGVDLAAGAGSVWLACSNGTVSRIDPATDQLAKTFRLGHEPEALAYGDGSVWVAVQSATG